MGHWFKSNPPDISGGSSVGRAIEKNPIVVPMFVESIIEIIISWINIMKINENLKLTDYQIKQIETIIIQHGITEENLRAIKEHYPREYEKLCEAIITLCQFGLLKLKYGKIEVNIS